MNKAIEYIEDNIHDKIDYEELSKVTMYSKFHFRRMFYILTEKMVGEYICARKLTLAAKDVLEGNKVIDIALNYGYESPESFSKAFKKFHGISPSNTCNNTSSLKAVTYLSFQIIVKGEDKMNYRIEKRGEFSLVGFASKKPMNLYREDISEDIPEEWRMFKESKPFQLMASKAGGLGVLGIGYEYDFEKKEYSFMAGIEGVSIDGVPNATVLNIETSSWAVFETIGPLPKSIQEAWQRIYSEWFPSTKYEQANLPTLEVHLGKDITASDYKAEIWVPIK